MATTSNGAIWYNLKEMQVYLRWWYRFLLNNDVQTNHLRNNQRMKCENKSCGIILQLLGLCFAHSSFVLLLLLDVGNPKGLCVWKTKVHVLSVQSWLSLLTQSSTRPKFTSQDFNVLSATWLSATVEILLSV